MSLVDITPLSAEDEIMDPATRQYVDSSAAIAEARSDAKLAEFRATVEAYTARAEEREIVRTRDFARLEASLANIKRAIVTATLSAILSIAALNAALYQGILSMSDVGRHFGTTQAEIQSQLRVLELLLRANDQAPGKTSHGTD
ncbi:hypothetical protein GM658_22925 [Pseudoduganella eburnea]|uniref:Uncharacterized protein n=1 Tax=Massilia eburnea TaxID=1776165 RepID=A0A6L6QNL0_9BURK|nr:hypothetical protein [Massilia eburnea]MTW13467.1 hypothetical protein [Massilia eburnea]